MCYPTMRPSNLRCFVFGLTVAILLTLHIYHQTARNITASTASSAVKKEKEEIKYLDDGPPLGRRLQPSTINLSQCRVVKRKNVTCQPLVQGEEKAIQLSRTLRFSELVLPCLILNLVENCSNLVEVHGYMLHPMSQEELEFPLAFTIKMHTNADQGEQLLRTIYRSHNVYCIYVDRKTIKQFYMIMQKLGRCFDNVFVIEGRQRVTYASIDLVHAELECMRVLMKSKVKWKYYINLTGQEFPLRTNLEIVQILKSLNGANDVESYEFPEALHYRFKHKYVKVGNTMVETNNTHPPFRYRIRMRKGSAYAMLTYDFVNFVLHDDISEEFISWLSETYSPEETLFATLNSLPWAPGGYDIETSEDNNTFLSRAVKWQMKGEACGGRWVRAVCVYGPSDLPWLVKQPQIIANKFDINIDTTAVDCLEERIRYRTHHPDTGGMTWSYYKALPHTKIYQDLTQKIGTQHYFEFLANQKQEWIRRNG